MENDSCYWFQESQWNPEAVSAMGVQGIMMLTEDTAKDFNVTDRQDPKQNILAGSLHFFKYKSADQ